MWKEANPERPDSPSNYVIHNWLKEADITSKLLVPVPVARNQPRNIQDRHNYSKVALGWTRERLVYIDETTFSKGLHQSRGRSKRGTLATVPVLNSGGVGMKVCAAVSPVVGLVYYETSLVAWNGDSFARFMQRLCDTEFCKTGSMIFVMDNVALHFTQAVKDAMAGLELHHDIERLPVYSPHLNPIEYCFHNWKTELKHIDQIKDTRTLQTQIEDTRVHITAELVANITTHVYRLYAHCMEDRPLEEFQPIGHRVARAQQEAARQREVIRLCAEDEEEEEKY